MPFPVIYLHGFASGPASRKAQFFQNKLLEHGIMVHVPDLNEGGFEHLTLTAQLAIVERLAGDRPVRLIGSSLGGYLSAVYASRHPEVERLVLLAPAFGFPNRWRDSLGSEQVETWKRTGKLPVYHYGDGCQRNLGYQLMEDATGYEDFPDFHQQALILHGRQDPLVPANLSEQFAATHSNARLCLVDSGHELMDVLDILWQETAGFFELSVPRTGG